LPAPEYRSFPSFWNSGKRLSPETILQSFPSRASLENVYGAITYYLANYLANQSELDQYLRAQEQKREDFRNAADPLPPGLDKRVERSPANSIGRSREIKFQADNDLDRTIVARRCPPATRRGLPVSAHRRTR
jgi:hypothetical protein